MTAHALASADVRIESHLEGDGVASMAREVRDGLRREPRELPPRYFYDARGSELFDQITQLPEYYPTRLERALLNRHAPALVRATRAEELVELGSGTASKTRALLYAMAGQGQLRRYVPFDVEESVVRSCADELVELYPGLPVHGVVGDFERHLAWVPRGSRRLVAFLGGTIGNLQPRARGAFLSEVRKLLEPGEWFLVGVALVTDRRSLEAAYNDSAGVTAEFNRNVLRVLNAELGANFDPAAFRHVPFFDEERSWIEMRLRAVSDQRVEIRGAGIAVDIEAGEDIRTEVSCKFTRAGITCELAAAGMRVGSLATDPDDRFAVVLATIA